METTTKKRRTFLIIGLLSLFALLGAACGDDSDKTTRSGTAGGSESEANAADAECPTATGLEASGSINISGSSTVAPITTQAKDCFADAGGTSDITVDNPGTGDGFKLFCAGETDISDASRKIKPEEATTCQQAGIEFIEIKIGFDGLTVMTNPANESVECLSFADLYALVGPESQGFKDWKDAQALATELGSKTTFPDQALDVTAPGEESGTYDSFIEIALAGIAAKRVDAGKITKDQSTSTRPDYTSQANDDAIIQGIEGSDGSFGWVGFAFADQAGEGIKEIKVSKDPGGTCVGPSPTTIADGAYPLSRSLYIYVNKAKAESNKAIPSFVDFYVDNLKVIVEKSDYVALASDQADKIKSRWEARTTGTAS